MRTKTFLIMLILITFKAIVMSTKSFGVLFYLKYRSVLTHEEGEVYLRITVNKAKKDHFLQRRCLSE
jgi:hypothetical protein